MGVRLYDSITVDDLFSSQRHWELSQFPMGIVSACNKWLQISRRRGWVVIHVTVRSRFTYMLDLMWGSRMKVSPCGLGKLWTLFVDVSFLAHDSVESPCTQGLALERPESSRKNLPPVFGTCYFLFHLVSPKTKASSGFLVFVFCFSPGCFMALITE